MKNTSTCFSISFIIHLLRKFNFRKIHIKVKIFFKALFLNHSIFVLKITNKHFTAFQKFRLRYINLTWAANWIMKNQLFFLCLEESVSKCVYLKKYIFYSVSLLRYATRKQKSNIISAILLGFLN